MNRSQFINYIESIDCVNTFDVKNFLEEKSYYINWEIFLKTMLVEDDNIDNWINDVVEQIENLYNFYTEIPSSDCDSLEAFEKVLEVSESELRLKIEVSLSAIESLVFKHSEILFPKGMDRLVGGCNCPLEHANSTPTSAGGCDVNAL